MTQTQLEHTAKDNATVRDKRELKELIRGLYDHDMQARMNAAKALGLTARHNPAFIRRMWPRIFYAFDDTMSCWGVAEGLGEIARNMPEVRSKITIMLHKFKRDESSCQGFVWAVCRIGMVDRTKIGDFIPELVNALDSGDVCMVGQSIWALGELRVREATDKIKGLMNNDNETWIYEHDAVRKKTIREISREALVMLA